MNRPPQDNPTWAQTNGYEYHAHSDGVLAERARRLDSFRRADGFRDHVVGRYRDRPFEILDFRSTKLVNDDHGFVWRTLVLIPLGGLNLPNFDLLPRRETRGMNFLGIKGLDLMLAEGAPAPARQLVDGFNKNYSLFAGGAFESIQASIKSASHLVPSLVDVAGICKPGVLHFLTTACTGSIEVQDGYLAVRAPETRIIRGSFSDTVLEGAERESLLTVANDLLDVLEKSASEPSLPGLTLENTFRPTQVIGSVIGGVAGFFGGGVLVFLTFFAFRNLSIYLILFLPLVGAIGGSILGRKVAQKLHK